MGRSRHRRVRCECGSRLAVAGSRRRNPAHVHMTIAIPGKVEWWVPELRFAGDSFLSAQEIEQETQKGSFASIRPLDRQADGTLRCVRDIRLPQGW